MQPGRITLWDCRPILEGREIVWAGVDPYRTLLHEVAHWQDTLDDGAENGSLCGMESDPWDGSYWNDPAERCARERARKTRSP